MVQEKLQPEKIGVLQSFRPVYYFSRIFGLMPFSIACDTRRDIQKPQINVLDGVWFVCSMLIYISMAIISYKNMKLPQDTNKSSFILVLGDYLLLYVGLIYGALIILFDMLNRYKLVGILNKYITFDNEVSLEFCQTHFPSRKKLIVSLYSKRA